jgi:hypothetical protein
MGQDGIYNQLYGMWMLVNTYPLVDVGTSGQKKQLMFLKIEMPENSWSVLVSLLFKPTTWMIFGCPKPNQNPQGK